MNFPTPPSTQQSDRVQELVKYYYGLTTLKEHFDHRFKQVLRVKGIQYDDYELTSVTELGFELRTEYSSCGDTDHDYHFFPLADLDVDVDELNQRENERIAKGVADAKARDDAYKARLAHDAEVRDKAEYTRLRLKYEHEPSL